MVNEYFITFPTEDAYTEYLLTLKWKSEIICPFCNSKSNTPLRFSFRFHCNSCNSDHSLTVNTVMHNTKIDLRKWVTSLDVYLQDNKLSSRKLSVIVNIDKKTAYRILKKFNSLFNSYKLEVAQILGYDTEKAEALSKVLLINTKRRRY
ncbi:transposase [Paenibacillus sp. FSL H8-0034]|uniref:transposase n=1 Tax=Paenibacillus sp. FSL H8-0034 TaxID=2954671 RepID=UPI0040469192